ncbi:MULTISPECIES: hypothetical protein [unclassified Microbacterium]|uniref:hypothetical protein n=1 Tax=unclassified Microbacterium TaxID=2609290 RepID=UPI0038651623
MRADEYAPAGDGPSRAVAAGDTVAGRTEVKERVLVKIAEQAAATAIGVPRGDVSVDVADHRGGMAITLRSPLPIPPLDDDDALRDVVPVLERAASLQEQIRAHLAGVLGRDIVRVDLTVTGARIPERKRVR